MDMAAPVSSPSSVAIPKFRCLSKSCPCPSRSWDTWGGVTVGTDPGRCWFGTSSSMHGAGRRPGCGEAHSPRPRGFGGAWGWAPTGLHGASTGNPRCSPSMSAGPTLQPGASRGTPLTHAFSRGAAVGFGKGPAGSNVQLTRPSNKNKPRGEIFIFARVYSSM